MKKIDNFDELDRRDSYPQETPTPNIGKDHINPGTNIKPIDPDEISDEEKEILNREQLDE